MWWKQMRWSRIAAYATGGVLIAVSVLRPGAGAALVTPGVGLIMWATKFPGDRKRAKKRALEEIADDAAPRT